MLLIGKIFDRAPHLAFSWGTAFALTLAAAGCASTTMTSIAIDDAVQVVDGFIYALPRALVPIEVKRDDKGLITVAQSELNFVPDAHARFRIERFESAFAHDKFIIQVDGNGLLTSANSDNKDETVEITKKIIQIVSAALNVPVAADKSTQPPDQKQIPFNHRFLLDPFAPDSFISANSILKKFGFAISARAVSGAALQAYDPRLSRELARSCHASLCFRMLTPVVITVTNTARTVNSQFLALIPDPNRIARYDLFRGPCVQRTETLTFANGVLSKSDLGKPSEVLGCLEIPLEVARAIASIPGQLLTVRVQNIDGDKKLVESQRQLLDAQRALLVSQAKLARERESPGAAD